MSNLQTSMKDKEDALGELHSAKEVGDLGDTVLPYMKFKLCYTWHVIKGYDYPTDHMVVRDMKGTVLPARVHSSMIQVTL